MYNEQIEQLINAALADGVLTEKEKQILFKKAQGMGIDLDEFEMVLDARLVELQKAEKEKSEKSAPKSTKYGDVRKCPVCGALVPALAGTCPECGYEFSGVDANLSSQKLLEMLIEVDKSIAQEKASAIKEIVDTYIGILDGGEAQKEKEKRVIEKKFANESISRKINIIQNFVIPTTKADLFEFIVSLQTKMNDKKLKKAYQTKFNECILKVNTLFPNDPMFDKIIRSINEGETKRRKHKLIVTLIIIGSIFLSIGIPTIYILTHNEDYCERKVSEHITKGNLKIASMYVHRQPTRHNVKDLVIAYVRQGDVDKAIDIFLLRYTKDNDCQAAEVIREELAHQHRFEEVMQFTNATSYGSAMLAVIKVMCAEGKKDDAKEFVKTYSSGIHCYDDGTSADDLVRDNNGRPKDVIRLLNRFIDAY